MSSIQTNRVLSMAEGIKHRYDPENDTLPNGPRVTWAEYQLMEMVLALVIAVDDLQEQIETLQSKVTE